jgi:uncharacterized protein YbcI
VAGKMTELVGLPGLVASSPPIIGFALKEEDKVVPMHEAPVERGSPLLAVSNVMVKLHKAQFGRGPTKARAHFAGPDTLVCVLSDLLLPAERKLVEMGNQERVINSRTWFQYATRPEFITAVEQIVQRKVIAFASGIDPDNDTAYETFSFEPRPSNCDATLVTEP